MSKVYVVNLGRKFYYHKWTDPRTGKRITRSARTSNRREAERKAIILETQLSNSGNGTGSESWEAFQDVYEFQHLESLSSKAMLKSVSVLSAFGSACRKVRCPRLRRDYENAWELRAAGSLSRSVWLSSRRYESSRTRGTFLTRT